MSWLEPQLEGTYGDSHKVAVSATLPNLSAFQGGLRLFRERKEITRKRGRSDAPAGGDTTVVTLGETASKLPL